MFASYIIDGISLPFGVTSSPPEVVRLSQVPCQPTTVRRLPFIPRAVRFVRLVGLTTAITVMPVGNAPPEAFGAGTTGGAAI